MRVTLAAKSVFGQRTRTVFELQAAIEFVGL
jgi:hypothetical protein